MDTSGTAELALARLEGEQLILLGKAELNPRQSSTELIPALERLLVHAGVRLDQLNAIVVVKGPGSFTGLRIGLSAAKGLAEALEIPVIVLSSLEVLAIQGECHAGKQSAAVTDAGRGEVYLRLPDGLETVESTASLAAILEDKTVVVADDAITQRLSGVAFLKVDPPGASGALRAAIPRLISHDFDDLATLDANYVLLPYADRKAVS